MKEQQKIEYLKLVLKETLRLYYEEKTKRKKLFAPKPKVAHFEGVNAIKDAGNITRAELVLKGMYYIGNDSWEDEDGNITTIKLELP